MKGKKPSNKQKTSTDLSIVYAEAQSKSIDAILTADIRNRSAIFVVSKCIVHQCKDDRFGLLDMGFAFRVLMYAPHESLRKQAAKANIGTVFNTGKFVCCSLLYEIVLIVRLFKRQRRMSLKIKILMQLKAMSLQQILLMMRTQHIFVQNGPRMVIYVRAEAEEPRAALVRETSE